jgi:hypothetical protein
MADAAIFPGNKTLRSSTRLKKKRALDYGLCAKTMERMKMTAMTPLGREVLMAVFRTRI